MGRNYRKINVLTAFLIGSIIPGLVVATESNTVGKVISVSGSLIATSIDASQRKLKRRSKFNLGETLRTGKGSKAQLRFLDGTIMSMRAETEYRIDEYSFSKDGKGDNKLIGTLLKGGMRTITGLIGKRKPESYKMKTSAATIGIRGTVKEVVLANEGLYAAVWKGGITLENDGGKISLGEGAEFDFAHVKSFNDKPTGLLLPPKTFTDRSAQSADSGTAKAKANSEQKKAKSSGSGTGAGNAKSDSKQHSDKPSASHSKPAVKSEPTQQQPVQKIKPIAPRTQLAPVSTTASMETSDPVATKLIGEQTFDQSLSQFATDDSTGIIDFNSEETLIVSKETTIDLVATDTLTTDPILTDPVLTDPVLADPILTDPVLTDPVVTDPVVTDPVVTDPVVTDPVVTDPVVTDPVVTDPVVTDPVVTDPVVTDPVVTDPVVTDPISTDARLTSAEQTSLDRIGLVLDTGPPGSSRVLSGKASDGASGSPIFAINNLGPGDPNFDTAPIDVVVRKGTAFGIANTNTMYNFSWGQWLATASTPVIVQTSATDPNITNQLFFPVFWATALPASKASVDAMVGTILYNNVIDSPGGGPGGLVSNLVYSADINFTTGDIQGHMVVTNNDIWDVNFVGILEGPTLIIEPVDMSGTVNGISAINGHIDSVLTGSNAQAIIGGYAFEDVADTLNHVEGLFLVECAGGISGC